MTIVKNALRPLGITCCCKGFEIAVYSIHLAVDDDTRLQAVTKEIYMEAATHFKCQWTTVERSLRSTVNRAWKVNPALLRQMAGYPLPAPPTASEFIEIISFYITHSL